MILSMTGHGQGRVQFGSAEITAEVRAVNNRHLKIQTRTSDSLTLLEPKIENLVRSELRRGSLQLTVRIVGNTQEAGFQLNRDVVRAYFEQCEAIGNDIGLVEPPRWGELLDLPGVVIEVPGGASQVESELETQVLETVRQALQSLNQMRQAEGQSMRTELQRQLANMRELQQLVERRAPEVVESYRKRLSERVSTALRDADADFDPADLVREVTIMADKSDVREELVRLGSHFAQFATLLESQESQGRKLDFLIQEMFREVNTVGAKSPDAEIAQRVVDMKAVLEQMRELVQNVE